MERPLDGASIGAVPSATARGIVQNRRLQEAASKFANGISVVKQSAAVRLSHPVSLKAIVGTGLKSAPRPSKAGSKAAFQPSDG